MFCLNKACLSLTLTLGLTANVILSISVLYAETSEDIRGHPIDVIRFELRLLDKSISSPIESIVEAVGDDVSTLETIGATLAYMRENTLGETECFRTPVKRQLLQLCRTVNQELSTFRNPGQAVRAGDDVSEHVSNHELPIENVLDELIDLRRPGPLDVAFRLELRPNQLALIQKHIKSEIEALRSQQQFLLMNDTSLSQNQIHDLWLAFLKKYIAKWVFKPVAQMVESEIEKTRLNIFGRRNTQNHQSTPSTSSAFRTRGDSNTSDNVIDWERDSEERMLAFFVSLFPFAEFRETDKSTSNQCQVQDVRVVEKMSYAPFTQITYHARLLNTYPWWFVVVGDVSANDGRLGSERRLSGMGFAFNVLKQKLYFFDQTSNELSPCSAANQFGRQSKLEFDSTYTGQNASALMSWLAEYPRSRAPTSSEALLDQWNKHCPPCLTPVTRVTERKTLNEVALQVEARTGNALIASRTGEFPKVTSLTLPPLTVAGTLGFSYSFGTNTIDGVPYKRLLFPAGLSLRVSRTEDGKQKATLSAPRRLALSVAVTHTETCDIPKTDISSLRGLLIGKTIQRTDVIHAARQLVASGELTKQPHISVAKINELVVKTKTMDNAMHRLPEQLQFSVREVKLRALIRLGKLDEAKKVYNLQLKLLETVSNKEFAGHYTSHYASLIKRAGNKLPSYISRSNTVVRAEKLDFAHILLEPVEYGRLSQKIENSVDTDVRERLNSILSKSLLQEARKRMMIRLMDEIWKQHPNYRFVGVPHANIIEKFCRNQFNYAKELKDAHFLPFAFTLQWQIYHALRCFQGGLASEADIRKTEHIRRFCAIIRSVRDRLDIQQPFSAELNDLLDQEILKSCNRIKQAFSTPFEPLCYYPLPERNVRKALSSTERRMESEVTSFRIKLTVARRSAIRDSLDCLTAGRFTRIDFFQNDLRIMTRANVQHLVSILVGHIFGQYCIKCRELDFRDSTLFPFGTPQGVDVAYRRIEGLTTRIVPEYVEVQPSN